MTSNRIRYKQLELYVTYALLADAALFVFYLLFAGLGITWAKTIFAILAILLSVATLVVLYLSRELLRRRSLWMTVGAAAVLICILFSLLLRFPSPSIHKNNDNNSSKAQTAFYSEKSVILSI